MTTPTNYKLWRIYLDSKASDIVFEGPETAIKKSISLDDMRLVELLIAMAPDTKKFDAKEETKTTDTDTIVRYQHWKA